mgnify:CR=1 FL=1
MRAKTINFERGVDPKDAMSTGLWKPYKDIYITGEEFKELGGVLQKDRELFDGGHQRIGYWLSFDENQHVDLMYNSSFQSMPMSASHICVKVEAKIKVV